MQETNCDGCGMSEHTTLPEKARRISPVEFVVSMNSRDWVPGETMKADLCETCIGTLLKGYFGHKPEGVLDVPDFLKENTEKEPEPKVPDPGPIEVS